MFLVLTKGVLKYSDELLNLEPVWASDKNYKL